MLRRCNAWNLRASCSDVRLWRRLLAYAPGHPIIAEALRAVTSAVLTTYREHKWLPIIPMTGPDRFHFSGVVPVLKRNGYVSVVDYLLLICA